MDKCKKIAINIQSEVQFFSLFPLIEKIQQMPYEVFILVDYYDNNEDGYKEMAHGTMSLMREMGVKVFSVEKFKDTKFDLCLTPYMDGKIKSKCYLKYEYGTLNIKPNLTYIPCLMEGFHGFLCQSTVTADLLSVYGKTFLVDNLRFLNKKRKKMTNRSRKKVLLFAPTYNDKEDEEEIAKIVKELRKDFYVIIKGHHGIKYLKNAKDKKYILEKSGDEYYGSECNLSDLILKSDVCLFGNSSAIGEALYAEVPCAIFTKDLDYFRLDNIHTTQFFLVKRDILPHTSNIKEINATVKEALSSKYIKRQKEESEKLFPVSARNGVSGYISAIEYFLNNEDAQRYIEMHDCVLNIRKDVSNIKDRENELLRNDIEKEKNKIYKIEGKIIHAKN